MGKNVKYGKIMSKKKLTYNNYLHICRKDSQMENEGISKSDRYKTKSHSPKNYK